MIYWTIANIYPELRSNLLAINLYGIARTQFLKRNPSKVESILKPLVDEILKLKSEGIDIT